MQTSPWSPRRYLPVGNTSCFEHACFIKIKSLARQFKCFHKHFHLDVVQGSWSKLAKCSTLHVFCLLESYVAFTNLFSATCRLLQCCLSNNYVWLFIAILSVCNATWLKLIHGHHLCRQESLNSLDLKSVYVKLSMSWILEQVRLYLVSLPDSAKANISFVIVILSLSQ